MANSRDDKSTPEDKENDSLSRSNSTTSMGSNMSVDELAAAMQAAEFNEPEVLQRPVRADTAHLSGANAPTTSTTSGPAISTSSYTSNYGNVNVVNDSAANIDPRVIYGNAYGPGLANYAGPNTANINVGEVQNLSVQVPPEPATTSLPSVDSLPPARQTPGWVGQRDNNQRAAAPAAPTATQSTPAAPSVSSSSTQQQEDQSDKLQRSPPTHSRRP